MAPANHLETPSPNELLKNGLTEDLKDKYLKIRLIYHDRAQKSLFTRKHVLEVFKQVRLNLDCSATHKKNKKTY